MLWRFFLLLFRIYTGQPLAAGAQRGSFSCVWVSLICDWMSMIITILFAIHVDYLCMMWVHALQVGACIADGCAAGCHEDGG